MRVIPAAIVALLAFLPSVARSAEPLFNGRDFPGWVKLNCPPNTSSVPDGMTTSTAIPTGVMRTTRQYDNFILELEWRHLRARGNAGVFVWSDALTSPGVPFTRSIEVQ